ncbi:MAG: KH domain-containing protein [Bacilli bacterium]|nr:KH domain-containing protein [Bacilli bacterium]MCH4202379.1 KH domain-containing protein [Bacilli bacterium]MCH4236112.1 KH domain-containing protein [Bacilli bacterium]
MEYQQIVHTIIDPIVEHKDALLLREIAGDDGKTISIIICAEPEDTARLIGRKGMIADSLREVISIAGKTDGKRIYLKFESFEKKDED